MEKSFGVTSKGEKASLFYLKNGDMVAVLSDYGATVVKLLVPDNRGNIRDVVLGYDDVTGYEAGTAFIGAVVGRVANRIGGGEFQLDGHTYELTRNENGNTLHGGRDFMNKRLWKVEKEGEASVTFLLYSPDGDQGFPGDLDIRVTYELTKEKELKISYYAKTGKDTIINLTNHGYFNLCGHASGDVLSQQVMIDADYYTVTDAFLVPTGELAAVEGTPMDFRKMKPVGEQIEEDYGPLHIGRGYDHNWALNGEGFRKAAVMYAQESGITMEVYTDLPGMQFYASNMLEHERGKEGAVYKRRQAVCFESQYFPDAVNKDNFKSPLVRAGEIYRTTTAYRFV